MTAFRLTALLVEYQRCPLGLDEAAPRFSWKAEAEGRSWRQSGYRIRCRRGGETVWDSGEVAAAENAAVYAGAPLAPCTRYDWTLTVTGADGSCAAAASWFETGLMDPTEAAWEGAQWIGGGDKDLTFAAHYFSVYKIDVPVAIVPGSDRASFLLGGNDHRLMHRNLNIQGVENARDESYVAFELDLSGLAAGGCARVNVYRAGYAPGDDPERALYSEEIPTALLHAGNAHEPHTLTLHCNYGDFDLYLDGQDEAHKLNRPDPNIPAGMRRFMGSSWNLNPVGRGGNFISFPMVGDVGVRLAPGQTASFGPLKIYNYRKPHNALCSGWPAGLGADADGVLRAAGGETGLLRLADPSNEGVPMLRRRFTAAEAPVSARLYITARGVYNVYANGALVNEGEWFNPGCTQYNRTHLYQVYELTNLTAGENVLAVELGEGWWSGSITFQGENWNFFGDRSSLLCKLVLTYADGRREVVTSDTGWRMSREGVLRYSSFFQGERCDLRRRAAMAGWTAPGFDDGGWRAVQVVLLDPHTAFMGDYVMGGPGGGRTAHFDWDTRLVGQIGPVVGVAETLTAKALIEPRPGVYVYDMGQNLAGIPAVRFRTGRDGQLVTLRYAETLYPDLPEYGDNVGMIMLENIRGALSQDLVTLAAGDQRWNSTFTFHGYRYIEITGIDAPLPLEDVTSWSLSSVTHLGAQFETSNPAVNQLWSNITWSLRDNFISIPTDCPQRNERMGWSGDISVFSRTATYLADCPGFLRRQTRAIRDTQAENGRFADIAPLGGGFGGVLWGSAGCTVPWESYLQFGDTRVLAEHADAMFAYLRFLRGTLRPDGIVNDGPLGDWLGPQVYMTEAPLLWQAYYVFDLRIAVRTAELLGRSAEAGEFRGDYDRAKASFNRVFVDPETHQTVFSSEAAARGEGMRMGPPSEQSSAKPMPPQTPSGRWLMDTQTSYAVPLALEVLDEAHVAPCRALLAETVRRENRDEEGVLRPANSLMTGFIGTAWISQALNAAGEDALAYRLLQNDRYPSWLYSVKNGATTIWERLNSYTVENGFGGNNSMNSFNHYSFGAVGTWMCQTVLGIRRAETPANFRLAPVPDPDGVMTWAKGGVDTVRGRFESGWEKVDGGYIYTVTVPAGVTAPLELRAPSAAAVTESDLPLAGAEGVSEVSCAAGVVRCLLGSGSYRFEVRG